MRPIVGVGVLIIKDGKVLLGKRNEEPGKNTWSLPGGKLEFGETFEVCAKREVKEETGLDVDDLEFSSLRNDRFEKQQFVTLGLEAGKFLGEPKNKEEQITAWRWFDLNGLTDNLFPPSRNIIENFLSNKVYEVGK
ncbi:MAG: hypothetical protein DRP00_02505 [Candidatus Aenigmatarchaeota archaeon]|nr:MAG: hypothetical protein DRP00_02505 [Candidatus Aenigmarchaeota archaeon]